MLSVGLDKVLGHSLGMEQIDVADGIEFAVQQLIAKVESSQALIDDLEAQIQSLELRLKSKDMEYKKIIELEFEARFLKMQEELDYYYLLSRKQFELIQSAEDLQVRTFRLLLGSDH